MYLDTKDIAKVLADNGYSKRKLIDYRVPSVFIEHWYDIEFVPFCDKAQTKGVLLFENDKTLFAVKFDLKKLKPGIGGVSKPILCDFCYTLQPRSQMALITFDLNREKTKSVAHYCCVDLQCSLNVRGLTTAALRSKTHIKEDISPEARILRYVTKTSDIFNHNGSSAIK